MMVIVVLQCTDLTDHSHKLAGAHERMISVKYYQNLLSKFNQLLVVEWIKNEKNIPWPSCMYNYVFNVYINSSYSWWTLRNIIVGTILLLNFTIVVYIIKFMTNYRYSDYIAELSFHLF